MPALTISNDDRGRPSRAQMAIETVEDGLEARAGHDCVRVGSSGPRRSVEDGQQSRIAESEAAAVARCASRSLGETRAGARFQES